MSNLTEAAIESTFLSLLQEKPLDRITVLELSRACGINRKTFYNHFEGVGALLDRAFFSRLSACADTQKPAYWMESFCRLAAFLRENRNRVLHIDLSAERPRLEKCLQEMAERIMRSYAALLLRQESLVCGEAAVARLCGFYASGMSGLVLRWTREGMDGDFERELDELGKALSGTLRFALRNASVGEESIHTF